MTRCARSELTVGELTQILGQSQPRLSRHLRLLCESGLLQRAQEGTHAFFRLAQGGEGGDFARSLVAALPAGDAVTASDLRRLGAVREQRAQAAETYFRRTECIAGVEDMRFQELMPDVFHWLGIGRIDRWVSMSNLKHDALRAQGIEVVEQVAIPEGLVPLDAQVEMTAKKAAGYFAPAGVPSRARLRRTKGRGLGA